MKNDRQHELDKTAEILDVITGLDYRLAMASLLSAYTTIMKVNKRSLRYSRSPYSLHYPM